MTAAAGRSVASGPRRPPPPVSGPGVTSWWTSRALGGGIEQFATPGAAGDRHVAVHHCGVRARLRPAPARASSAGSRGSPPPTLRQHLARERLLGPVVVRRHDGKWSYSSLGAGSLTIPAGGSVAFAWEASTARPLRAWHRRRATAPSPTASPTPAPTPSPEAGADPPSPTTRPTPTPTAEESVGRRLPPTTPTTTLSPTAATPTPSASQEGSPHRAVRVGDFGRHGHNPDESPGDATGHDQRADRQRRRPTALGPDRRIVLIFGAAALSSYDAGPARRADRRLT